MNFKNINIRLTVLALVLFLFAFLKNDPIRIFEKTFASAAYLLEDFNAADVESIEISQNGNSIHQLQKVDSKWLIRGEKEQQDYQADSSKIHEILTNLEKLKKFYDITNNADRFAEFGLSDNGLKITLNYSGKKSSFYIGNRGTAAGTNLVRLEKGTTVYSVNANLQGQWNQNRDYFRFKKLVNFTVENIATVHIAKGRVQYDLTGQAGKWNIIQGHENFNAQATATRFFQELLDLKGGNFYHQKKTGTRIGLITITYKSNVTEKIEFRKVSSTLIIVRSDQNPYWQIIPDSKMSKVLPDLNQFRSN
ncbi:MAG: DUF4340 domain-containing protein [Leptospirales bacterium]